MNMQKTEKKIKALFPARSLLDQLSLARWNYLSLTIAIIILATAFHSGKLNAQEIGVSISDDNSAPNANAMLDVKSPATGAGKGIIIPRVTAEQRTSADSAVAGGLLDDSGKLRGGAAQGLLVYQTDAQQGFYYNRSDTDIPNWAYIGVGDDLMIGNSANTSGGGVAIGASSNSTSSGVAIGTSSNGISGIAIGTSSNGVSGIAIGKNTTGYSNGVAIGLYSNGRNTAVAIGANSNAYNNGTAVGYQSNARQYGASLGRKANGQDFNVAIGYCANGFVGYGPYSGGVAIGYRANCFSGDGKYTGGVAIGYASNARHNFNENDSGAVAIGCKANAFIRGVGVGWQSAGYNQGVAIGYLTTGSNQGVGVGYKANAAHRGVALGYMANSGNKNYSFAKGPYSKCQRYNEEWKCSDGYSNKYGYGQANYHGYTTTANSTEIYLGGSSYQRFLIASNSVVSFEILISARNTSNGDSSVWRCWGGIERGDHVNTTTLIGTKVIDSYTQGTLNKNPAITADTTNGALKLQVTGVNRNTVIWNARITYSETRQNGW